VEERDPDSPLRFVVVDGSGRTSGAWYIKTAKNSDDLFLWERTTAGQFKVSLHNEPTADPETLSQPLSQPWRLAMTREYAEAHAWPREVLWEGRQAPFTHGTVLAPGVLIPRAYLKKPDQEPAPRFIRYTLPAPNGADVVVFRLLLADNDAALNAALAPYRPFARLRRSGGGWVGVGTIQMPMSAAAVDACEFIVAEAEANAKQQGQPAVGRIVGVFSPDETGIPVLADLSSNSLVGS
jgi:hypothetical protein